MNDEAKILKILETTKDPLLDLTAKELNLAVNLELKTTFIRLHLTAGFPINFLETHFLPLLESNLRNSLPHYQIEVRLKQEIKAHSTQLPGKGLRGVKNTIAIASGKGGVGKSTLAVNLAASLTRLGARVGILDADIYGPSMPLMLGKKQDLKISGEYYLPLNAHGIQAMSIGYLTKDDSALIWRGPMLAKSLIQLLEITLWDELDYLLIDLPPGTGDIQLTLVQKIPLTGAIIVTTPQQVATLDAQKAITLFSKTNIEVLGVIENMSTHRCTYCNHQDAIFGEGGAATLCAANGNILLGQLPLDSRIRQYCDEGQPIALQENNPLAQTFLRTAMRASFEISKKPLNYAVKFPNIVVE